MIHAYVPIEEDYKESAELLKNYSAVHGIPLNKIGFTGDSFGSEPWQTRKALAECIQQIEKDGTLLIAKTSHIGRSPLELLEFLERVAASKVKIHFLDINKKLYLTRKNRVDIKKIFDFIETLPHVAPRGDCMLETTHKRKAKTTEK